MACRMENVWNGRGLPSAPFSPKSISVCCFGVAVKAKKLRLSCCPWFSISLMILSSLSSISSSVFPSISAYSFKASFVSANAIFSFMALSPVWLECASSTMTANFLRLLLSISWKMIGNFCNVVTMMRMPSLMASRKSLDVLFLSISLTTPSLCSKP